MSTSDNFINLVQNSVFWGDRMGELLYCVNQLELAQEGPTSLLGRLDGSSVWFSGVKPPRVPVASLRADPSTSLLAQSGVAVCKPEVGSCSVKFQS